MNITRKKRSKFMKNCNGMSIKQLGGEYHGPKPTPKSYNFTPIENKRKVEHLTTSLQKYEGKSKKYRSNLNAIESKYFGSEYSKAKYKHILPKIVNVIRGKITASKFLHSQKKINEIKKQIQHVRDTTVKVTPETPSYETFKAMTRSPSNSGYIEVTS